MSDALLVQQVAGSGFEVYVNKYQYANGTATTAASAHTWSCGFTVSGAVIFFEFVPNASRPDYAYSSGYKYTWSAIDLTSSTSGTGYGMCSYQTSYLWNISGSRSGTNVTVSAPGLSNNRQGYLISATCVAWGN